MEFTPEDEKALRAILGAYHSDPFRTIAALTGVPLQPVLVEGAALPVESPMEHAAKVMHIARSIDAQPPYSLPDQHTQYVEAYLTMIRLTAADAVRALDRVIALLIPASPGPVSGWQRPQGTYDAYAYDERGVHVHLHDERAVAYTLLGAIYKGEATHLLPVFAAPFGHTSIPLWEASPDTEPEHVRDYLYDIRGILTRLVPRAPVQEEPAS